MARERALLVRRCRQSSLRLVRLQAVREERLLNLSHKEYWNVTWSSVGSRTRNRFSNYVISGTFPLIRPLWVQ